MLVHGDQEGARANLQQADQYQRTHSLPVPVRLMEARQARAWLALGQWEAAEHWASAFEDEQFSPGFVREFEVMTLARFHLLQERPEQALALLDLIYPVANSDGHNAHVIEILSLTALAQQALGELQLSINTLHTALRMAEPEGYLRTFVDAGSPMAARLVVENISGSAEADKPITFA